MFWRKKQSTAVAPEAKPQEAKTKVKKAKKLSPKEVMIKQFEEMTPGQALKFRLGEIYGGDLAVVELNSQYPDKGRKYTVGLGKIVDGKPAGKINRLWDSNKPKDVAGWLLGREGKLLS